MLKVAAWQVPEKEAIGLVFLWWLSIVLAFAVGAYWMSRQ